MDEEAVRISNFFGLDAATQCAFVRVFRLNLVNYLLFICRTLIICVVLIICQYLIVLV